MKKIGLFNNMNNMNFCLARYLRDAGYDVTLFLLNEYSYFLPQNDTYDAEDLKMIKELDWYKKWHWKTTKKEIRETVKDFNPFLWQYLI
jgi:hypothetical protein